MITGFSRRRAADMVQIGHDLVRAQANRQHYAELLNLAKLSRRCRPNASRVTPRERADLDMIWRQYCRFRRLERFLCDILHRSSSTLQALSCAPQQIWGGCDERS